MVHHKVGEADVFHHAALHFLDFNGAPVGVVNHAIRNGDVAKLAQRFGANAECSPAGFDNTIGDHDAKIALLQSDGIIAGVDMTVGNHNVFAQGQVQTVVVLVGAVKDMHAVDAHLFAFFQVAAPRSRVLQGELADRDILTIGEAQQRGAVERLLVGSEPLILEVVIFHAIWESRTLPVHAAFSGQGDVMRPVRIDQAII